MSAVIKGQALFFIGIAVLIVSIVGLRTQQNDWVLGLGFGVSVGFLLLPQLKKLKESKAGPST